MSAQEMLELADEMDQCILYKEVPGLRTFRLHQAKQALIAKALRLAAQSDAAGDGPVAWRWRWPFTHDPFLWSYNDAAPPVHDPASVVIEPLYAHSHAVPQTARETAHALNEWADLGSNAVQWIRNIAEGISSADDALHEMVENYERVLKLSRAISGKPGGQAGEDK